MYSNGEGVVVNNIKAYMWVTLAAYNTSKYSKHAGKIRGELAKKMTPADISKAQDMSSLCLESNYTDCQTNEINQYTRRHTVHITSVVSQLECDDG